MAVTIDHDQVKLYEIEPNSSAKAQSEEERVAALAEESIERRVYYIRGRKGRERVIATIRARSRSRAIEIAAGTGIKVDKSELIND